MRQWRLIYDFPTPGMLNMAIDEALLMSKPARPTLRLYAWQPYCLSLGYGQRVADVDEGRLRAAGYDLVRRPTGGRAILHTVEVTYSLILPPNHPIADGGVIPSYRRISRGLVAGLQQLGMNPVAAAQAMQQAQQSPVCFETPSHYEVTANGCKLIGSAQLRRKAGVLQHGSLPLVGDIGAICNVLHYDSEITRKQSRQEVQQHATTLYDALDGVSLSWQHVADALVEGFQEVFDVVYDRSPLNVAERQLADDLAQTKYGNRAWNARR